MFSLRPERQLERTLPRRSMRGSTQEDVAPSPIETVQEWLGDVSNDVVVVGHSQGVNIAMSVLNRGLDLEEPNSHRAQFAHWSLPRGAGLLKAWTNSSPISPPVCRTG